MIKVGIDTLPLKNQNAFRGVGNYTKNLIDGLDQYCSHLQIITGDWRDFWPKVDLVHFPYFDFFFCTLPLLKSKKIVVTVHDCIPLVFPEQYKPGIKGKIKFFIQKSHLKKADAIITDSQSSKRDIIKFLSYSEEKIHVVFLAPSPQFKIINSQGLLSSIAKKYQLPKKFVLYVGDVNYNKNLLRLIESFSLVPEEDLFLVLIGKAFEKKDLPEVKDLITKVNELSLASKVKFLGYVPTDDLVVIYNLASVYCQPSLYEGFGLQILEAMACGCPVVTSIVSSLPEIAGDAAVLVNPEKPKEIAKAIYNIVSNSSFSSNLKNRGLKQVKNFSWEKTSLNTGEIYEKIVKNE